VRPCTILSSSFSFQNMVWCFLWQWSKHVSGALMGKDGFTDSSWAWRLQAISNGRKVRDCVCVCVCVHLVMTDSLWPCGLQPARLLCPWNFPSKNTGAGCHLFQSIFPIQGLNLHHLHWQVGSLLLAPPGSPASYTKWCKKNIRCKRHLKEIWWRKNILRI